MSSTQTTTTEVQTPLTLTLAYDNQAHEEVFQWLCPPWSGTH